MKKIILICTLVTLSFGGELFNPTKEVCERYESSEYTKNKECRLMHQSTRGACSFGGGKVPSQKEIEAIILECYPEFEPYKYRSSLITKIKIKGNSEKINSCLMKKGFTIGEEYWVAEAAEDDEMSSVTVSIKGKETHISYRSNDTSIALKCLKD